MSKKRICLTLIADILIILVSLFLAHGLQWSYIPFHFTPGMAAFVFIAILVTLGSIYFVGVYHRIWQYGCAKDFLNIIIAVTLSSFVLFLIMLIIFPYYARTVIPSMWLISICLLGGSRFVTRLAREYNAGGRDKESKNTLIIGAGEAGFLLVKTLQSTKTDIGLKVIGFVDDDLGKKGLFLNGLPVLGTRNDIPEIVKRHNVYEAIIAIPTANPDEIRVIADICIRAGIIVKVLPSVLDILQGKDLLEQLREFRMEDLLPRSEVEVNLNQVSSYLKGETVLVTGAGGSIGSELCRQICRYEPKKLILMGRGENSIYDISLELAFSKTKVVCIPVIGDIRDKDRVYQIFSTYKPSVIFHAAAHKHVTLMELHPDEAFKNNVFGTLNLVKAADFHKAKTMVLISTDKAVNPSSVMGLTKLLAEMIVRCYALKSSTTFCAVRFGNVLGSRGSVLQLFRKQIAAGGPVTITHPEMRRYFMTIREAVQLVLQAGALAKGGEVFMLDMGEQVRIVDLAQNMIRLSGLVRGREIEIKYIGAKPGEKLSEELLTAKEKAEVTQHRKIFVIKPEKVDQELLSLIEEAEDSPGRDYLDSLMKAATRKYMLSPAS